MSNNSQEKNSKLANWLETRINSKKKNEVARLSYKWNYNNSTTEKEEEYVANEEPEPQPSIRHIHILRSYNKNTNNVYKTQCTNIK